MGLRPCRECNAQVSTEAEVCPHCGVRNPTHSPTAPQSGKSAPPTRRSQTRLTIILWSAIVGFLVFGVLLTNEKKTPEQLAQEQTQEQERQAREKERQDQEHARFSADFDRLKLAGSLAVTTNGAEKFDISGWNSSLDLYIANRSDITATILADLFCHQYFKPPLNLDWKVRVYFADNTVGAQCSIR
jgi:hypothetical protein